jgi:hypothetical protein
MKPRYHATALAVVGWYLMLPPFIGHSPQPETPLSLWTILQGFDDAAGCNKINSLMREFAKKDISKKRPLSGEMDDAVKYAQCVASDDPRLAK